MPLGTEGMSLNQLQPRACTCIIKTCYIVRRGHVGNLYRTYLLTTYVCMYCNVLDDICSLPALCLLIVMIFMVTLNITSTQIQVTALHFDTHKHRDREQIHTRSLGW